MDKPFSQACENNRLPIFNVLSKVFLSASTRRVLEIGSGTGQHGTYFSKELPNLEWNTSDLLENHAGINLWIDDSDVPNIRRPVELDVTSPEWKINSPSTIDFVYSANTCHIMPWEAVKAMFEGFSQFTALSKIALYGPFKFEEKFTSESNAQFDAWLKGRAGHQGIRNFEDVCVLAQDAGFTLCARNDLPANNHLLIFEKTG